MKTLPAWVVTLAACIAANGLAADPFLPEDAVDVERLVADRMSLIDSSGIRKVFDLARELENPVNLSIGQPDFDVPEEVKAAAVRAIETSSCVAPPCR